VETTATPVTIRDVLEARLRIAPYLTPTPLVRPAALGRALGADVHLKLESLQPVGAFKVRGGVNLVAAERETLAGRRLLAASTGNHGQSIAYAGRLFGLPVTVYAPAGANPAKVAAMRALGADVQLVGKDFDEAREACEEAAARLGARYVHSMNEPLLVAGVGTAYLEALEAVPDAQWLIVPVGGGSGLAGAAIVARALVPGIRVIGVQAQGAPAFERAFRTGRLAAIEKMATRAEGLATRQAFDLPVGIARRLVDEVVLVSDAQMDAAMRLLLEDGHVVAEMAGAAGVAAAMQLGAEIAGARVVVPITGANVAPGQVAALYGSAAADDAAAKVAGYYRLVDAGDVAGIVALFAPDGVYERPGYEPFAGRAAIERFYRGERVIASGAHTIDRLVREGEAVVAEGRFEGRLRSGAVASVRFTDIWRFAPEGLVAHRTTYFFAASV